MKDNRFKKLARLIRRLAREVASLRKAIKAQGRRRPKAMGAKKSLRAKKKAPRKIVQARELT